MDLNASSSASINLPNEKERNVPNTKHLERSKTTVKKGSSADSLKNFNNAPEMPIQALKTAPNINPRQSSIGNIRTPLFLEREPSVVKTPSNGTPSFKSNSNMLDNGPPLPISSPIPELDDSTKKLKKLVTNWFLQVSLKRNISIQNLTDLTLLFRELRDGVLLCHLINALHAGAVQTINDAKTAIAGVQNLSAFAGSCMSLYGVERKYMFRPLDFHNGSIKGEEGMIHFLAALALKAAENGFTVANFPVNEAKVLLAGVSKNSEVLMNFNSQKQNLQKVKRDEDIIQKISQQQLKNSSKNNSSSPQVSNTAIDRTVSTPLKDIPPGNFLSATDSAESIHMRRSASRRSAEVKSGLSTANSAASQMGRQSSDESFNGSKSPPSIIYENKRIHSTNHSPLNVPSSFVAISELPSFQQIYKETCDTLEVSDFNNQKIFRRLEQAINKPVTNDISNSLRESQDIVVKKLKEYETLQKELMSLIFNSIQSDAIEDLSNEETYLPRFCARSRETSKSPNSAQGSPVLAAPAKMFNKLPDEVVNANLDKKEMFRLSVIYEMMETEVDFVRDMKVMTSFHIEQMKRNKILGNEESYTVFSNVDELISVAQLFVDKLTERKNLDLFFNEVGDVIVDISSSFKAYSTYCANYPKSMGKVQELQKNPEIKDFLQKLMQAPESRGLSLESFLIKPIQRICKYPLLLREILKYTDKQHKDYSNILLATEKIDAVVKVANEATRVLGERDRITVIQGRIEGLPGVSLTDKKLFKEGISNKLVLSRPREKYFLLCGEFFIMCKILSKGKYQFESLIYVYDLAASEKGKFQIQIQFGTNDKKENMVMSCNTEDEKLKWLEAFQDAIKEFPHTDALRRNSTGNRKKANRASKGFHTIEAFQSIKKVKNINENLPEEFSESLPPDEPEIVEAGGEIWKRTPSAMGICYYYNTMTNKTIWKLPEDYVVLNPVTMAPMGKEEGEMSDDADTTLEEVPVSFYFFFERCALMSSSSSIDNLFKAPSSFDISSKRKLKETISADETESSKKLRQEQPESDDDNDLLAGLTDEQRRILKIVDAGENHAAVIDVNTMKKIVLKFEKAINKNAELRTRFSNTPLKFIDSEADLDEEIKKMTTLSASPHLYQQLISLGSPSSILSLLSHENIDISMGSIELLNSLIDEDSFGELSTEDEAGLKALVSHLIELQALELLVQNLSRLDEERFEEKQAVFSTLSIFENMINIDPTVCESLVAKTKILSFLISRLKPKSLIDSNKEYASEILSILLQNSRQNRLELLSLGGLDNLLRLLAGYKRKDPKDAEEIEIMENVFDVLCYLVAEAEGKRAFLECEGVELMLLMLKERKMSRIRAINVLDFCMLGLNADSEKLCLHFIECLGLKTLFSIFMGKHAAKLQKIYNDFSNKDDDEHMLSIISSLLKATASNKELNYRLVSKFIENSFEKISRLVVLLHYYVLKLNVKSTSTELDEGEESVYLFRLENGLFIVQLLSFIVAVLYQTKDEEISKFLTNELKEKGIDINFLIEVLGEYAENVEQGNEKEILLEAAKCLK